MKSKLSEAVYEYVRTHPECTATDVGQHIGASRNRASSLLSCLRRRGLVVASPVPGSQRRIVFTAIEPVREPDEIIERARQIGHPFGIVAAQVMA